MAEVRVVMVKEVKEMVVELKKGRAAAEKMLVEVEMELIY